MDAISATPPQTSSLREAYDRAAAIIGSEAERFEIAEEVERLRLACKPSRVRVVMLAESHVWTSDDDFENYLRLPEENASQFSSSRFVRFIYCLAYGEPSLLTTRITANPGTRQYWNLLHDAVREPTHSPIPWSDHQWERVRAKRVLLDELKDAGVWLVDASVTALYKPRYGCLVTKYKYREVLRCCWEAHVRDVIANCGSSGVLIVGSGVNHAIGRLVRLAVPPDNVEVVKQPNARMKREVRYKERRKVFDFCRCHRSSA